MLNYEGIFFDEKSLNKIYELEKTKLEITNDLIHCTFRYHPKEKEIFNEIVGNYYCLLIIRYACDGQNSGFLIDLPTELQKYYINYEDDTKTKLRIPHITCSYSKNAIPNKTKDLNFLPIKPVKIKGRFGYWIKEENNEYLSFEPFYENKNN